MVFTPAISEMMQSNEQRLTPLMIMAPPAGWDSWSHAAELYHSQTNIRDCDNHARFVCKVIMTRWMSCYAVEDCACSKF